MTTTAMTTAAIITQTVGHAHGGDDRVEREEMSSSMIWTMTPQNELAAHRPREPASSPSMRPWISQVALATRKRPPTSRMMSRPENVVAR